jgi:hypothetical protein
MKGEAFNYLVYGSFRPQDALEQDQFFYRFPLNEILPVTMDHLLEKSFVSEVFDPSDCQMGDEVL